ncbi:MAG: hypothetical protein PQJ59_12170 [Spirochaetales bacterium]|nr:hypothetical protein [Spirochaetales bacterium]
MREFLVNGSNTKESVTILEELKDGYNVKITRYRDDWKTEREEFMPKQLLDSCLRTNYLVEKTLTA